MATAQSKMPGQRKRFTGSVVGDGMDKTIVVQVLRRVPHGRYGKVVSRRTKLIAHDEGNRAKQGDQVLISETRPFSKTKRWRLVEVLKKAQ